ncbi:MAG: hypothetical protein JO276_14030 [Sphingomonadaceae bacterium]|nr:hypothetical protein [Sphingomonadaceae bacterium]
MNPYEMVAFIVLVSVIGSVLRAIFIGRHRRRDRAWERDLPPPRDDGETARLRDEVKQLRERLHVLERITVEKENSLEREIERLRDQP